MDIGELRPRQVNDDEDDQVRVLSNSNVQDDTNQSENIYAPSWVSMINDNM